MAPRRSLRARFVTASALLVITGTIASAWTLIALSRLSGAIGSIVRGNDRVTASTARLSSALEREDDALLLIVAGDAAGRSALVRDRGETDAALAALADAAEVGDALHRYRAAADAVDRDALLVYHREVNPLLRAAIATIGAIRDRHFAASQAAAARAHDEARRARTVSLAVVALALVVSVLVALRLARAVIGPLAALRRSAVAIQDGTSGVRADVPPGDELGEVAAAFNAMATHLDEFRRSNLAEVLQAKADLEATLAELVRVDRMRVEMIAVASHELRTPATTLRMTLGMLRERAGELPPALRELIDTAMAGVVQLTETVDELLDLTRVEAGELRLAFEPVDLARLIDDALPRWRARSADRAVAVELAGGGPAIVRADRSRLRSVLDNLVDNAIKYSPSGGAVTVAIAPAAGAVAVTVSDRGPGIPPELAARVFDKFFRVEDHVRRPGDAPHGTGIGLYLCKALIEMHGGSIACEPVETGARLRFEVPASMQNARS